jgi:hypothetical protein
MTVIATKFRVGRVFRQIRRCLVANDGKPVLMAQILEHAYPRAGGDHPKWHYRNVYRCLGRYAIAVDRLNHLPGRPYVWAPNAELRKLIG